MARPKKTADQASTVSVSLRIDPRIKYGIDLAARIQKRTVTGVVEWAVQEGLQQIEAPLSVLAKEGDSPSSVAALVDEELWSADEAVRFFQLASNFPSLLTYEETQLWETIKLSPPFWNSLPKTPAECCWENAQLEELSRYWWLVQGIVSERKSAEAITYADLGIPTEIRDLQASSDQLYQELKELLLQNPKASEKYEELAHAQQRIVRELQALQSRLRLAQVKLKAYEAKPII
ncbi:MULTISPECIES: hypothetical protein [Stutzerimonas]|uniref:hypothetical protein n=1 Tax=Stutzerimonas TaxID=2901164 RepID=UPI00289E6EA1|nr:MULTISPECIES: hypothetical protein [Stutzerimonas]